MKYKQLPSQMQNEYTLQYWTLLKRKKATFFFKRLFDIVMSFLMIILLIPFFVIVSLIVMCTSKGPIFYTQIRVTKYCKNFKIIKFRTMINNADKNGPQVTVDSDVRVTKVGRFLRKTRMDEVPQLFNILVGQMSFVGPRPEVEKYVKNYTDKMYVTLLLKAGVTSLASITFKNESELLKNCKNVDETYVKNILPKKMEYNYDYIEEINIRKDLAILVKTIIAVII